MVTLHVLLDCGVTMMPTVHLVYPPPVLLVLVTEPTDGYLSYYHQDWSGDENWKSTEYWHGGMYSDSNYCGAFFLFVDGNIDRDSLNYAGSLKWPLREPYKELA